MKKIIITLFTLCMCIGLFTNSVDAATSTAWTERGYMKATLIGTSLAGTNTKYAEWGTQMLSGQTSKLYLTGTTVGYYNGARYGTSPRNGGYYRTIYYDYDYFDNCRYTTLKTYSTHEAVHSDTKVLYLSQVY